VTDSRLVAPPRPNTGRAGTIVRLSLLLCMALGLAACATPRSVGETESRQMIADRERYIECMVMAAPAFADSSVPATEAAIVAHNRLCLTHFREYINSTLKYFEIRSWHPRGMDSLLNQAKLHAQESFVSRVTELRVLRDATPAPGPGLRQRAPERI